MQLNDIVENESLRREAFPVAAERIFMAHAGVCPLPKVAVDAMNAFCARGSSGPQENAWSNGQVLRARQVAARLIGADADEIALLGPTALGLSLVANGMPWKPGDEVVFYPDDYPSNVYPWMSLAERGVKPVALRAERHGVITWEIVESALTPKTRLVSLASCNFLSGYRIDVDEIGQRLHERGILFCVDGIQTLGAFPMSMEHVDFLSADSHKWLLGPMAAGIVYVKREHQELLRPSLLGAWNVVSPGFVAQDAIRYESSARRYEPGALNVPGIIGMLASMELLLDCGIDAVGKRLLALRRALLERLRDLRFRAILDGMDSMDGMDNLREGPSGIVTVTHDDRDMKALFKHLDANGVTASLRQDRAGTTYIRFSPHFYNTVEEVDRVAELIADARV
ncbi:MAG: aminotransferase class V-fold PLP-dependent enzyme [Candidatus Hydrogenedentes bacterium]|nr:aminotransferase class V-fold PLP-dependent enzyme [Candidatus Hydrogenedentota bacterium]